ERLDPAVRRADARLAHAVDEPDLRRRPHVDPGAPLARPATTDVDHPHRVAVLLAEQRDRARGPRLVEREDARDDLEVVTHRVVGDLLDLAPRRRGQPLIPGEVEPQITGFVERPRLVRLLPEG